MQALIALIKKVAASPSTILILGESGTGKELVARAIHEQSPRRGKPFQAVNCAAIPDTLMESELFGYEKGAFSGAASRSIGLFEAAHGGTMFLDEIGDLGLNLQAKILRTLQERTIRRIGGQEEVPIDVRVVAATNKNIEHEIAQGRFRQDLFYRLNVVTIRLPPLRDRTRDIPILADIFLIEIATQMGKPVPKLSNEALRTLVEHEWKGNVRELRHCLEQAVALNDGPLLTKESLRLGGDNVAASGRVKQSQILPDPASDAAVLDCLRQHGFDMQATAKTLCWDRSTVTQRLKGLCFKALVEANGDQSTAAMAIAGDPSHLRSVELRLMDYYNHLLSIIESFATPDEALLDCKRRFKNLPDRHFASVETLVRQHFRRNADLTVNKTRDLRLPH